VRMNRQSNRGVILLGVGASIVSPLPLFLTGAMAAQITDDLAFGAAGLGLAVVARQLDGTTGSPAAWDRVGVRSGPAMGSWQRGGLAVNGLSGDGGFLALPIGLAV